MRVYDKEFDVKVLKYEDLSRKGSPDVRVVFIADGETYHYSYCGSASCCTCSVKKVVGDGKMEEVYSTWKPIASGYFFREIGSRIAVSIRTGERRKSDTFAVGDKVSNNPLIPKEVVAELMSDDPT